MGNNWVSEQGIVGQCGSHCKGSGQARRPNGQYLTF